MSLFRPRTSSDKLIECFSPTVHPALTLEVVHSRSSGSARMLVRLFCLLTRRLTGQFSRHSTPLPFSKTRNIFNSFNSNREVKISRDGELRTGPRLLVRELGIHRDLY